MKAVEAEIDEGGAIRLLESLPADHARRAVVLIFDKDEEISETALLSEAALAEDWNRPEEDTAWLHLNRAR